MLLRGTQIRLMCGRDSSISLPCRDCDRSCKGMLPSNWRALRELGALNVRVVRGARL